MWVSTDDGVTFTSVFDGQATLAIGAVALDTTTMPNSTIYVGTGEGNTSIDSLYGNGLYKSTDLGQHWTALSAGTFQRAAITSLALDTQTTPGTPRIFVGTTSAFSGNRADAGMFETDTGVAGLWRSDNGGTSFTHYLESNFRFCDLFGDGTAPCPVDDVKLDPTNPQNLYVAVDGDSVYYSNDGGSMFHTAALPGLPQGRQSLAVGPPVGPPNGPASPPGGAVYAMLGTLDGGPFAGMFVSFDAGATWNPETLATPPNVPSFTGTNGVTIDGTNPLNFSQSFYDQAMLVSPTDGGTVYFGGVGLYKSANFGNTWTFLAPNGGIHPDIHAIALNPGNGHILVGTDGGLFSFDPTQGSPRPSLPTTRLSTRVRSRASEHILAMPPS